MLTKVSKHPTRPNTTGSKIQDFLRFTYLPFFGPRQNQPNSFCQKFWGCFSSYHSMDGWMKVTLKVRIYPPKVVTQHQNLWISPGKEKFSKICFHIFNLNVAFYKGGGECLGWWMPIFCICLILWNISIVWGSIKGSSKFFRVSYLPIPPISTAIHRSNNGNIKRQWGKTVRIFNQSVLYNPPTHPIKQSKKIPVHLTSFPLKMFKKIIHGEMSQVISELIWFRTL